MYTALEVGQPGNNPCPNQYEKTSSHLCPGSRRAILQISNQAVFVSFGIMQQGLGANLASVQWQPEQPFLPCLAEIPIRFDAVRVRNYTAGAEAQAIIAVFPE